MKRRAARAYFGVAAPGGLRARKVAGSYGYEEIRVPLIEHTELFKRAQSASSPDVVEKEMYTFNRPGWREPHPAARGDGRHRARRDSNGLLRGARHKLWCIGPMFRHERPQKGRYRQFYQLDLEAIGFAGPDVDAELIALTARLWAGFSSQAFVWRSTPSARPRRAAAYREILVAYFRRHESALDADSRRRLEGNPLRILDSKNPQMAEVIAAAPLLTDHLDEPSRDALRGACRRARSHGHRLSGESTPGARALDYYSRTVFEWLTDALGAQDAVCSGGTL